MNKEILADINAQSASALVGVYNQMAKELDKPLVTRFSDKKTAVRRVTKLHEEYSQLKGKKAAKSTGSKAAKGERKKRGMRFIFPRTGDVKTVRSGTNRETLVNLLSTEKGATFEECLEATWAKDSSMDAETQRKTCYEAVRLLHYYVGYGMTQDSEGRIRLLK